MWPKPGAPEQAFFLAESHRSLELMSERRAVRRLRVQVPHDIISDMVARRRMGQTLREIASATGYGSAPAVLYVLRNQPAPTAEESLAARNARKSGVSDAEILRARAAGVTLQEIGRRFGLTRERVRQIVDREGGPTAAQVRAVRTARSLQRREDLAAADAVPDFSRREDDE